MRGRVRKRRNRRGLAPALMSTLLSIDAIVLEGLSGGASGGVYGGTADFPALPDGPGTRRTPGATRRTAAGQACSRSKGRALTWSPTACYGDHMPRGERVVGVRELRARLSA